jgi:carbamoyltransferase
MYIIGINAAFHDSAACIIKDGQLIAAAEEERFTHIKHGKRPVPFSAYELPFHSINYCLETAGIHLSQVDHVIYAFDPELVGDGENGDSAPVYPGWDHLFEEYVRKAPEQLVDGYPHMLQKRFAGTSRTSYQWHYLDHHIAHAASAFLCSPYENAAVMTIDGRGERATTSYYTGNGNQLTKISDVCMPHSLGMLYENVTKYLGFLGSSDEYKVMALASYGKPEFIDEFRSMVHVGSNGNYTIDELKLVDRFGPARVKDSSFDEIHFNIAHSLQKVLEETMLKLVDWLHKETQEENLCLAGGVALNCVLNAVLRDHGPFKRIWVQPASGDAGTALGAALWLDARERNPKSREFVMDHVYWGPGYEDDFIEDFLKWTKVPYRKLNNVAEETAAILADNKVIGWFQGRMEFGPRALGSRSILASPIQASMQSRLNEIKDREDFRPVAPVVMEDDVADWFENGEKSPFMLFVYNVRPEKSSKIPAVMHVDRTARIQTVNRNQHPAYYDLIRAFKEKTGVPVLINTSFNTRGEPIVCSPRDAIECFWTSPFDALVINSFLLEKAGK